MLITIRSLKEKRFAGPLEEAGKRDRQTSEKRARMRFAH